ncbi:hypothetical protein PInf_010864 [Phytophthora infestans]|nr:hypothetical protein PInf_010864 [Phytophthora infestans]
MAVTVPDCTTKRNAIKPGLIIRVREKNPRMVTTEIRPRPGLDEKRVKPGFTKQKTAQATKAAQVSVQGRGDTNDICRADIRDDVYRSMQLEHPPTSASESMSLPVMSWMHFAKDLYDERIEQICIISDIERVESEAEELGHLHAANTNERKDNLSAKTKKQCFDEQSWDSLKSSPFYDGLLEHKNVLPEKIPAELPQDKSIQHEKTSHRARSTV